MEFSQKYFTLQEAEELVPVLEREMGSIRDLKRQVEEKISDWQKKVRKGNASRRPSPTAVDEAMLKGQVDFLVAQINGRLEAVEKLGCLPKDLEMGLIDFPARLEGRECYLCWKIGEKRVAYWHGMAEGYTGRKPLSAGVPRDPGTPPA